MKKIIVSALSFLVVFFGLKYGMDYYRTSSAVDIAKQEIETIREDARKNNPDTPEVLAVQQAAIKRVEENINAKGSEKEKREIAAGTFMGFYLVNSRQRHEYCEQQGVDISAFSNAFIEAHKNEYAMAIEATSASPSEIDELYVSFKLQLVTAIKQDMEFIAKQNDVSLTDACKLLTDNPESIISEMHISVSQPAVYKALTLGQ